MKGIVFTEFLDLVEDKFGLEVLDKILTQSDLESGGVYTSVGTYSFSEMLQLLQHLSAHTSISIDDLLLVYAEHFFGVIEESYPGLLATYKDPIEMLSSIENHIHVEVRKIYPDAELPKFEIMNQTQKSITLVYTSSRSMYAFALGLIEKTFHHYHKNASISYDLINNDGSMVKFVILENDK